MEPNFFERVYALVRQIPRGKVSSYGQIAALLGHPQAARTVGWALNALRDSEIRDVPWQRVINSAGRISISRADLGAGSSARAVGRGRDRVQPLRLRGLAAVRVGGDGLGRDREAVEVKGECGMYDVEC